MKVTSTNMATQSSCVCQAGSIRVPPQTSRRNSRHVDAAINDNAQIVVDLSKVDYISSVGLRALMIANKQAAPKGCDDRVASMQEVVREVFTISHFDKVFPTFDEMPAALQAVSALAAAAYGDED